MTKDEEVRSMIVRCGDHPKYERNKKVSASVVCQGCHKAISSTDDLSEVDYVKTKRGSVLFFHDDTVWGIYGTRRSSEGGL